MEHAAMKAREAEMANVAECIAGVEAVCDLCELGREVESGAHCDDRAQGKVFGGEGVRYVDS